MITETNKGTGANPVIDRKFADKWSAKGLAMASQEFNWNIGYDLEEKLGYKITVKNQGFSSACGGFATAYKTETKLSLIKQFNTQLSPKFIYQPIGVLTGGGSQAEQLGARIKTFGVSTEKLCPSNKKDGSCDEQFITTNDISNEAILNATESKSINTIYDYSFDIDELAKYIRDNDGVIIGITGTNNGTWLSKYPVPPTQKTPSNQLWYHWVFACKAKLENGIKYIGFYNSWGKEIGDNGVQWISEDYVNSLNINGYKNIWNMFTPIFDNNFSYIFTKTIYLGSSGIEVQALQSLLRKKGYFTYKENTTYFGTATLNAVRKFQKDNGLFADGIVGKKTRVELNKC